MAYCKMYFGSPGTGKTTLGVKLAVSAIRDGIKVYTNFPCVGALQLDTLKIGSHQYENALCIVDEAGLDFSNRSWKSFPKETMAYVKLHRHYNTSFIFLSQGWDDCDKKIRTICTEYYNLKKIFGLTFIRQIGRRIGIDDTSKQIIDEYFKVNLFFGGLHCFIRKPYYKYFDSWEAPVLPDPLPVYWSVPETPFKPSFRLRTRLFIESNILPYFKKKSVTEQK